VENLSQVELDALIGAAAQQAGGEDPAAAEAADLGGQGQPAGQAAVRNFDFNQPNTLSRSFERNLRSLCESFSKIASLSFTNQVRTSCVVSFVNLRVFSFGEAYAGVENPSCIAVSTMPPLKGTMLLVIDAGMMFSLFTRLLGGGVEEPTQIRDFTELEMGMSRRIVERVLDHFRSASERIVALKPTVSHIENNPSYVQALSDTEMVLALQHSIGLDTLRGTLTFILPLAAFEPVRNLFDPKESIELRGSAEKSRDRRLVRAALQRTEATLTVHFVPRRARLREVLALKVDDVLPLGHPANRPLTVNVERKHMFDAVAGRSGQARAVRIVRRLKES
jgi:flagellar motor switch protein FliM